MLPFFTRTYLYANMKNNLIYLCKQNSALGNLAE